MIIKFGNCSGRSLLFAFRKSGIVLLHLSSNIENAADLMKRLLVGK